MGTPAPHEQSSPEAGLFRRGLRVLAAAGAFLLWAARRGFLTTWPV